MPIFVQTPVSRVLKVAITGSIASGKSTVRRILERLGAYTVDADQILHQAYTIDSVIGQQIVALLGRGVIEHGAVCRSSVVKMVLNEPALLDKIEDICHPYVNSMIFHHYELAKGAGTYSLFVAEVPLLFESRYSLQSWFDVIVLVTSDKEKVQSRLQTRNTPAGQHSLLEKRQLSPSKKLQMSQYVLENNGNLQTIECKVRVLFKLLCASSHLHFHGYHIINESPL